MRSKSHELAWALGVVQGILSVVSIDQQELDWFMMRGVSRVDLENLRVAGRVVASAFYADPDQPRDAE